MPNYKTHSIHSEEVIKDIKKETYIDIEDLKKFSFGPDALLLTNYQLFEYQHANKTKYYFETLLKMIKKNKLYNDSQVMSFLYGQLNHYILDAITHPLIYYMTENMPKNYKINPHTMIEMWIDDYIMINYNKLDADYYKKRLIIKNNLKNLINSIYLKIFHKKNIYKDYEFGILSFQEFDKKIRNNKNLLIKLISSQLNIGDFFYQRDLERIKPYLNLEHNVFYNPVTGEHSTSSFNDLWYKAIEIGKDTIEDANNYLYKDKKLNNYLIKNNISYNTGLPCKKRIKMPFCKKYE